PWTLLLPLALRALEPGPLRRHLLAWLGVVFVLFSLSVGKRNAYILPAFPAAAMVVAIGWGSINRVSVRWTHATAACTIGLVLLVGLIEAAACFVHDLPLARGALAAGAFLMTSGAAVLLRMY